jgi:hypothetical protein
MAAERMTTEDFPPSDTLLGAGPESRGTWGPAQRAAMRANQSSYAPIVWSSHRRHVSAFGDD